MLKYPKIILAILMILLLINGCSTHLKTNKDGQVISMKKIKGSIVDSAIQEYKMMYWSQDSQVEAYAAIPKSKGTYPLLVTLHGGYLLPMNTTHVREIGKDYFDDHILKYASSRMISVLPMYRGYGDSEGTVHSLNGDTIDTENAIKAITNYSKTHRDFPSIETTGIYINGISMGGGVALKLASERKDVKSVVAVSPFVGMDIYGKYSETVDKGGFFDRNMIQELGPLNLNDPQYKKQSINYKTIKAPTLIIEGTNDYNTPLETVKTFYQKMKGNHQNNVKLEIIQGGNHGLLNKSSEVNSILNQWYLINGF